jgi:hypothetical protein
MSLTPPQELEMPGLDFKAANQVRYSGQLGQFVAQAGQITFS